MFPMKMLQRGINGILPVTNGLQLPMNGIICSVAVGELKLDNLTSWILTLSLVENHFGRDYSKIFVIKSLIFMPIQRQKIQVGFTNSTTTTIIATRTTNSSNFVNCESFKFGHFIWISRIYQEFEMEPNPVSNNSFRCSLLYSSLAFLLLFTLLWFLYIPIIEHTTRLRSVEMNH